MYFCGVEIIKIKYLKSVVLVVMTNYSIYDIREYFQGRSDTGKMKNKSDDEVYQTLIDTLRENLKLLALQIEPKVYAYGFLKA